VQSRLEVVMVPLSDVDRSLAFYRDQVGFHLDVDWSPGPLTASCS
jgi:catechol 2,3-dioxygenase-like lactoylglutathione lyase family enzyme